jgi:hypothetical protein
MVKKLESGIVADSGRGIFSFEILLIHALRFLHLLRHRFRKKSKEQEKHSGCEPHTEIDNRKYLFKKAFSLADFKYPIGQANKA